MITIDILQLIDKLEEVLDTGRGVLFSDKVAIDRNAFLNIVDQMRITIPQEIRKAREVTVERDKYIAQAHDEARRIIAQAREDAAKMLDEHRVRQEAEQHASELILAAQRQAQQVQAGADAYAEAKLNELAQQVDQLQRVIQNGLSVIEQRRPREAGPVVAPPPATNKAPREVNQQGPGRRVEGQMQA